MSENFHIVEHIVPGQHVRENANNVRDDQDTVLRLHVKQYTPKAAPDLSLPLVTILAAHGNGFPKESYEALWDELLLRSKSHGFGIRSIWMADDAHEGQSYVLNEDKISDDIHWLDHSRDLLHMTNHFRMQMKRPIFGIGHSMGGAQLTYLGLMHPRLLTGLLLLDPVIDGVPHSVERRVLGGAMAKLSTYRRDTWPSRREASTAIRKSPMYSTWDDRAWDAFVKYGLRDLPTLAYPELPADSSFSSSPSFSSSAAGPPVTLTTPVTMEVHTFMRENFDGLDPDGKIKINRKTHPDFVPAAGDSSPGLLYRSEPVLVYNRLQFLRPPVLFVLGGTSFTMVGDTATAHEITGTNVGGSGGAAEGRAKRIVLPGYGHGIPFEAPVQVADACSPWIGEMAAEWRQDEQEWLKKRRAMSPRAHAVPSEEWKRNLGPPPSRKKSEKIEAKI